MISSINRLLMSGILTAPADENATANGTSFWKFLVSVSRVDRNGSASTMIVPFTTWGAELGARLADAPAGTRLLIEGRVAARTWQRRDGSETQIVEIIAERADLLDPAEPATPAASAPKAPPMDRAKRSAPSTFSPAGKDLGVPF
jgi:single-stranded DNA-binding protein